MNKILTYLGAALGLVVAFLGIDNKRLREKAKRLSESEKVAKKAAEMNERAANEYANKPKDKSSLVDRIRKSGF